jgi:hypothetical protein
MFRSYLTKNSVVELCLTLGLSNDGISQLPAKCIIGLDEKYVMNDQTDDLPEAIRRRADRIIHDIEHAGSMILAVKNGAKAEGFILGISCRTGLTQERCDLLLAHFEEVLEKRLRSMTLGR